MPRLTLLLFAIVAVLGFALAYVAIRPMPAGMDEGQVRSMIDAALAEEPAPLTDEAVRNLIAAALTERDAALPQSHAVDPATLNPLIEDYLLSNPRILQRVSVALDQEIRAAESEQARIAIASNQAQIFEDPDQIVLGNPNGDVTLVEMFDYNCGYCRQALPDLATLLAEDPNLKVILKEFPILSEESVDAARVAVLVSQSDADYWQFHQTLFTSRGRIDGQAALAAAAGVGLNPVDLELSMKTPEVTAVLDKSYRLADALSVSGTPTYIIGDEIIAGAVGLEQLRLRIANMRACGKTVCEPEVAPAAASDNS
jgi:protein-disulfide isomerase